MNARFSPFGLDICKTNNFNNITIWCKSSFLDNFGMLGVNNDNAYVITKNSTATYILKYDSNGNLIYENFISDIYIQPFGYTQQPRMMLFHNGFIYTIFNSDSGEPYNAVLVKIDEITGASTFQIHPFITQRTGFSLAIDYNSNTLYFGSIIIDQQNYVFYNYSINTFCL